MAKHAMLATFSAGTILKNYLLQKLAHYYELMKNNTIRQKVQSLKYFLFIASLLLVNVIPRTTEYVMPTILVSICKNKFRQ